MSHHVVVGAGSIGSGTALELVRRGHQVTLISRSGHGPEDENIKRVALDITDADALTAATLTAAGQGTAGQGAAGQSTAGQRAAGDGAAAIYNCVNPPYHRWPTDWPPLASAFLAAAERTGAGLVTTAPLYLYGPVDAPMTEATPENAIGAKGRVRRQMWHDALAAHNAGRIRATEVRASDFFGPGTDKTSFLTIQVLPKARKGKKVRMIVGDVDAPHAWTYVRDVATMMAVAGTDDRSWGRAWHVPTNPARSVRQVAADAAAICGQPAPGATAIPNSLMTSIGVFVPFVKELRETRHQFDHPFVLDSSDAQQTFGLAPTPWTQALTEALQAIEA